VNLITSHDGFTLRDLVSYEQKHNWANGEENRDGDNANHSSNSGVEGETEDVKIRARRLVRARALLAGMICAKGVPFLTAGDERWRTQQGNNNAYCQDNELNWLDWSEDETGERMRAFVKGMLAFRAGHEVLRRDVYFDGRYDGSRNLRDVTWLAGDGGLLEHELWHEPGRRAFGMLVDAEPVLLFLFNAAEVALDFVLPGEACARWVRVFDTALEASFEEAEYSASETEPAVYSLRGCSMVCLRLGSGSCLPVIAV
jgi:glycogen operon protein